MLSVYHLFEGSRLAKHLRDKAKGPTEDLQRNISKILNHKSINDGHKSIHVLSGDKHPVSLFAFNHSKIPNKDKAETSIDTYRDALKNKEDKDQKRTEFKKSKSIHDRLVRARIERRERIDMEKMPIPSHATAMNRDGNYESKPIHRPGDKDYVDPNKHLPFSHGGGKFHIERFLKGDTGSSGYKIDNPNGFRHRGIMVSPVNKNVQKSSINDEPISQRAHFYAGKGSQRYDKPAILTGQIKAKHMAAADNYGYEGGILHKNVKNIQNPKIHELDSYDSEVERHYKPTDSQIRGSRLSDETKKRFLS